MDDENVIEFRQAAIALIALENELNLLAAQHSNMAASANRAWQAVRSGEQTVTAANEQVTRLAARAARALVFAESQKGSAKTAAKEECDKYKSALSSMESTLNQHIKVLNGARMAEEGGRIQAIRSLDALNLKRAEVEEAKMRLQIASHAIAGPPPKSEAQLAKQLVIAASAAE